MTLDITTTAIIRPDILDKTLTSFRKNLLYGDDYRIILNVDPVGYAVSPNEVLYVYKNHFPNSEIIHNFPETPNFPKAFKWVWSQVKSEYSFHLEDDWLLLNPIDINEMLKVFPLFPTLAQLRFMVGKIKSRVVYEACKWNGNFYHILPGHERAHGFGGQPGLLRGSYVRQMAKYLNETEDPEKQLKNVDFTPHVTDYIYGLFSSKVEIDKTGPIERAVPTADIKDIGRQWNKDMNFEKHSLKKLHLK
jgi:hypothetical protein